ncbi:MAG: hypothetical protein Kow001_18550 [Acidobacteriota bacterium]
MSHLVAALQAAVLPGGACFPGFRLRLNPGLALWIPFGDLWGRTVFAVAFAHFVRALGIGVKTFGVRRQSAATTALSERPEA